jgi:hypothetical protein
MLTSGHASGNTVVQQSKEHHYYTGGDVVSTYRHLALARWSPFWRAVSHVPDETSR